MLNTLLRKLRERRDLRVREGKLRDARQARSDARISYLEAWTRGDTREMHRATERLVAATTRELQAGRG
jgi:hypothetical protein